MEPPEQPVVFGRVKLKMYGRRTFGGREQPLSARVFARKLSILINALEAADRAVNGGRRHDYFITRLKEGSGLVEVQEFILPKIRVAAVSSTEVFSRCVASVHSGNIDSARQWGHCAENIQKLASGADEAFGYGELWVEDQPNPFRVDEFLEEQSFSVFAPPKETFSSGRKWFRGASYGSFDGSIKVLDFRGSLPLVTLTLSAGSKEIDCILPGMTEDDLAPVMNKRATVNGIAYYDGRSGLPRRIEVKAPILPIKTGVDFTKWRGSFEPFEPSMGGFD